MAANKKVANTASSKQQEGDGKAETFKATQRHQASAAAGSRQATSHHITSLQITIARAPQLTSEKSCLYPATRDIVTKAAKPSGSRQSAALAK